MSQTPLRFLLIGCGGIASAHLKAFEAHPERLRLIAACDPAGEAAHRIAEQMASYGPVDCFTDHEAAVAAVVDRVDAVLITTPHFLHFPQAMACIDAGLPVLVEKPATTTLDEARALRDRSGELGVAVMVGQTRRFGKDVNWIKRWIRESPGHFGALRSFDLTAWQSIEGWIGSKPDPGADFWILDKARAGGGVVVSLLVHYLDLLRHLFETDYVQVAARGRHDPPFKNGAESSATALLTTADGATGTMHGNYLARKTLYCEVFHFLGEHGMFANQPLEYGQYSGPMVYATTDGVTPTGWEDSFDGFAKLGKTDLPAGPDGFEAQLLAFANALANGHPPPSSIEDNFNTLAVIDAIYRSIAADGKPMDVARN